MYWMEVNALPPVPCSGKLVVLQFYCGVPNVWYKLLGAVNLVMLTARARRAYLTTVQVQINPLTQSHWQSGIRRYGGHGV